MRISVRFVEFRNPEGDLNFFKLICVSVGRARTEQNTELSTILYPKVTQFH